MGHITLKWATMNVVNLLLLSFPVQTVDKEVGGLGKRMFRHFIQGVLRRLQGSSWVQNMLRRHGKNFDLHLKTAVLERGRGDYPALDRACLYAYRYMGMHADALVAVLKRTLKADQLPGHSDVVLDFGCGPATSVFAF